MNRFDASRHLMWSGMQIDGTMRSYMPDRTYIDMIYRNGELESIDDSGTP